MPFKDRLTALVRELPPAQRAGLAVAALILVMAAVPFVGWITTPSYALLYSSIDDRQLAEITEQLETDNVDYRLDGRRVLVPRDQLYRIRASLAQAGVSGTPSVAGYELLDDQALGISDFRQRIDLQRAWEGELSRTLVAMDAIDTAAVRLVLPEDSLFSSRTTPATASVLLGTRGTVSEEQIEAITLLVASAVEGLEPGNVAIADTRGQILHSPGEGGGGGSGDRQPRRIRDFEAALAADLTQLLHRATGTPASAVVRATMNFDESETQTETFDTDPVPLREHTVTERQEGTTPFTVDRLALDGGPVGDAGESLYERDEATREFGVGRTTTRTVFAAGTVEQLSIAVVVDEAATLSDAQLEALVVAAAGFDAARGDRIAISRVAAPAVDALVDVAPGIDIVDLAQRIVALLVLIAVVTAMLLMIRRRLRSSPPERVVEAQLRGQYELTATHERSQRHQDVRREVTELVERQPEEIAALLRTWLADRRP